MKIKSTHKLPKWLQQELLKLPEDGMGYTKCTVTLDYDRTYDAVILNCETLVCDESFPWTALDHIQVRKMGFVIKHRGKMIRENLKYWLPFIGIYYILAEKVVKKSVIWAQLFQMLLCCMLGNIIGEWVL